MKATIIFFLLVVSTSAVLSNPVTNVEDATNDIIELFGKVVTKILNAIGTESEAINESSTQTVTAFKKMVDSALNGTYDTDPSDELAKAFNNTLTGLAELTGYSGDDLNEAIQSTIDGLHEALDAVFNKTKSYLYDGIYKNMKGYSDAFGIVSKHAGDVDISEEIKEAMEENYKIFTGMFDANRQTTDDTITDVKNATKEVADLYGKIIGNFMNELGVEDEGINESVIATEAAFQETLNSAYNGTYNEESANRTNTEWKATICGLLKYINISRDELSTSIKDAEDGLQDAVYAMLYGKRNDVVKGLYKAMIAYTDVLIKIGDKIGNVDNSELISVVRENFYFSMIGVNDKINSSASTDDASS